MTTPLPSALVTSSNYRNGNAVSGNLSPSSPAIRKRVTIVAVEDDDDDDDNNNNNELTTNHSNALPLMPVPPSASASPSTSLTESGVAAEKEEDVIPGPPSDASESNSYIPGSIPEGKPYDDSKEEDDDDDDGYEEVVAKRRQKQRQERQEAQTAAAAAAQKPLAHSLSFTGTTQQQPSEPSMNSDDLQISLTEHHWAGNGILASRTDLALPPEEFAAGCNLLQAAARGDIPTMQLLLAPSEPSRNNNNNNSAAQAKTHVNFRDYDRRTAMHVAASEGHLDVCRFLLLVHGAKINRSDRWGGSPLDDAHRHRHEAVIRFLRSHGASTGSGNRTTNLITAAFEGDLDEVSMLLQMSNMNSNDMYDLETSLSSTTKAALARESKLDINKGDYDKRTALHLAAGEGHVKIVEALCKAGADTNVEDRWSRRPLDDALTGGHDAVVQVLEAYGAVMSPKKMDIDASLNASTNTKRQAENLRIDFGELEMVDRIGSGAFGEIYKCRWRGTMVAAKIIKSAKIRRDWVNKRMMDGLKAGQDVDDAVKEMDEAELAENDKDEAIADFRREISILKGLRHPQIVLLLAYSTTENYECLVSELMKCSLLDVFRSHLVQGTRMSKRLQITYATQLAQGMNYLHTCKPPIIHRDLKPANLLIDHSGVLKISDFGLSKVRPDPKKKEAEVDTFTMTGETGSYRFMAPEVYRHEHYNETVDIYSYAMILFYLLVGRPPWPNLAGPEAVKKASEEGDRPNIPRDLDLRLQSLLKEGWDDNPSLRPPFSQILAELAAYSQEVFRTTSDNLYSSSAEMGQESMSKCCVIL